MSTHDKHDEPLNHDEARQLAEIKQGESNLARCYLDLLARTQLSAVGPKETGWLIECVTAGTPLWYSGKFYKEGRRQLAKFVPDANEAVRYPTRAAAEWAFDALDDMAPRSILGRSCYRITEHAWHASAIQDKK